MEPNRFAGLSEDFFWEEEFYVHHIKPWAEENALRVANLRCSGMTHQQIADQIGKTIPTIRKAIKYAKKMDESF